MERSEKLLNRDHSVLVVVDMQETLLRAIKVGQYIADNIQLLIQTAHRLEIPIIFTTQNAQKLGGVMPMFSEYLESAPVIDKLCFSCVGSEEFLKELQSQGRTQVVLTGIEAHICITQTALDLVKAGYAVHAPYNAVASRQKRDWKYALLRLAQSGVVISSVESVVYEWLQEAGTEQFRAVLPLLKERERERIRADKDEEGEIEADSTDEELDDASETLDTKESVAEPTSEISSEE